MNPRTIIILRLNFFFLSINVFPHFFLYSHIRLSHEKNKIECSLSRWFSEWPRGTVSVSAGSPAYEVPARHTFASVTFLSFTRTQFIRIISYLYIILSPFLSDHICLTPDSFVPSSLSLSTSRVSHVRCITYICIYTYSCSGSRVATKYNTVFQGLRKPGSIR